MWAVAAQPRTGLTPMIPTPSVDSCIPRSDLLELEAEDLVNENHRDAAGREFAVDDEHLVDAAVHAICSLGASILERKDVFVDAAEAFLEVGHDLLRPNNEDDSSGTSDVGTELAPTRRGRNQRPRLGDRVHAAEHDVGRRGEPADFIGLCFAVHAPDSRAERLVPTGLIDLVRDPRLIERLRGAVMHLGSVRDQTQHDPFGFFGVRRPKDVDSVRFEGLDRAPHADVVPQRPEPTSNCPIQLRAEFGAHWWYNLQVQVPYSASACGCK